MSGGPDWTVVGALAPVCLGSAAWAGRLSTRTLKQRRKEREVLQASVDVIFGTPADTDSLGRIIKPAT